MSSRCHVAASNSLPHRVVSCQTAGGRCIRAMLRHSAEPHGVGAHGMACHGAWRAQPRHSADCGAREVVTIKRDVGEDDQPRRHLTVDSLEVPPQPALLERAGSTATIRAEANQVHLPDQGSGLISRGEGGRIVDGPPAVGPHVRPARRRATTRGWTVSHSVGEASGSACCNAPSSRQQRPTRYAHVRSGQVRFGSRSRSRGPGPVHSGQVSHSVDNRW